jgi:WD40 repeat protein
VVAAGVAVLINVWTYGWSWPAGVGLAVLIGCQAVFEWSRAKAVDRSPVRLQESTTDETSSGVRNSGSQTSRSSLTEAPRRTGQVSAATGETDQPLKSLALTAKGKWVVVGSLLNRASVSSSIPLSTGGGIHHGGHRGAVAACSVSGNRALTIGDDGVLKVWDISSGRLMQAMSAPPSVESAAIDCYGNRCVVGRAFGNLEVFDLERQFMARVITVDGRPVDDGWKTRKGVQDETLPRSGIQSVWLGNRSTNRPLLQS